MRLLSLFIVILLFIPFLLQAEHAFFVIPHGPVYKHIGLSSPKLRYMRLKFGERVEVEGEYVHGSITWYQCSKDVLRFYLPEVYVVKEPKGIGFDDEGNIPIGREVVDRWHSLPLFYRPSDLVPIPQQCKASGYEKRELLLRREAAEVFTKIIEDAQRDGVNIRVLSAYRDARYQSALYARAIGRFGVLQMGVAKPGHSEHQLGTTCDLTSDEIGNRLSTEFEGTAAYQWLQDHMYLYGVSMTYPKLKGKALGYMYEPWHYRYWGQWRWEQIRSTYGLFLVR